MKYPGVGTGVWVRKEGKLLMGRRIGKTGTGMWCVPGGKLELWEEWEANARRETMEEAGIEINNVRLMTITNDMSPEHGTHFATLHYVADWESGEPRDEEGKLTDWGWYEWGKLPEPLFWPTGNFIKSGYNPFKFN